MRLSRFFQAATLAAISGLAVSTQLYADEIRDYGPVTNGASTIERPGAVVWMDLLTGDVRAAAGFYEEVFNWNFEYSQDGSYAYATENGKPVASIASYDEDVEETEGQWLASISVPDVDAATAKVRANGGTVLEDPEDLPGRGRYVLIEDPTGAVLMLLRANGGDPTFAEAVNRWLWNELWTDDVDAATKFYQDVVGYRTVTVKDGSGGVYQVMGRDKLPHASVTRAPLPGVEPNWLAYILVEDVAETVRDVQKAGGAVLLPPQKDNLNSDIAIVADPTGGVFAIQQKEAK